jgi:hypothetical protein
MRIFLITLAVSIITSIGLWNFGIAHRIWPAHPLLCTTLLAMACGILAQTLLINDANHRPSKK